MFAALIAFARSAQAAFNISYCESPAFHPCCLRSDASQTRSSATSVNVSIAVSAASGSKKRTAFASGAGTSGYRGGNYADDGPGKMDCIDHSTSTTRLLKMLEARGNLRWHRVLEVNVRHWGFVFATHYSAVIEEIGEGEGERPRFAVDSWFVDNGQAAVVLPLVEWKKGAGPDV